MIRFVVIASLKRGAIEPAEILDDDGQAAAILQLEHDEGLAAPARYSETVYWRQGQPYVDQRGIDERSLPGGEKLPHITEDLRGAMRRYAGLA